MEDKLNQQAIWIIGSSCQAPSILGVKQDKVYKVTFDFRSYIPGDYLDPAFSEIDITALQTIIDGRNPVIKLVASSGNILHELFKMCNWFLRYGVAEDRVFSSRKQKSISNFNARNNLRLISTTRSLFDVIIDLGLI